MMYTIHIYDVNNKENINLKYFGKKGYTER
jgi:hypothetical protein